MFSELLEIVILFVTIAVPAVVIYLAVRFLSDQRQQQRQQPHQRLFLPGEIPMDDPFELRYQQLLKLGDLKEKGLLTEEEFQKEKEKLLA